MDLKDDILNLKIIKDRCRAIRMDKYSCSVCSFYIDEYVNPGDVQAKEKDCLLGRPCGWNEYTSLTIKKEDRKLGAVAPVPRPPVSV